MFSFITSLLFQSVYTINIFAWHGSQWCRRYMTPPLTYFHVFTHFFNCGHLRYLQCCTVTHRAAGNALLCGCVEKYRYFCSKHSKESLYGSILHSEFGQLRAMLQSRDECPCLAFPSHWWCQYLWINWKDIIPISSPIQERSVSAHIGLLLSSVKFDNFFHTGLLHFLKVNILWFLLLMKFFIL